MPAWEYTVRRESRQREHLSKDAAFSLAFLEAKEFFALSRSGL